MLFKAGEKPKPAQLEKAHAAFRQSRGVNPKNISALFYDGKVQAELGKIEEASKIAKEFVNDPLVMISVSWDNDEVRRKDFIAKNEMTWVQYRDVDHSLSNQFGINSIPHYFTIDSDGVLTAEMLGEDSDVEGKLKKLIAKAKEAKAQPEQARSQDAGTATAPGGN